MQQEVSGGELWARLCHYLMALRGSICTPWLLGGAERGQPVTLPADPWGMQYQNVLETRILSDERKKRPLSGLREIKISQRVYCIFVNSEAYGCLTNISAFISQAINF